MNAIAILITTAALGVDYGWHRGPDGEWEYIIQIEPGLVDTLSRGQALVSQLPPELRGVRRFRIQIGQGEVPRDQLPAGGLLAANAGALAPGSMAPGSMAPGSLASGGFGASNFGGPGLGSGPGSGWHSANQPPEPGAYAFRNFDWLRTEPIRVDPLENSYLADLRNQGFEIGPSPSYPPNFPTILAGGQAGALTSNFPAAGGLPRTAPGSFASQPGGGFGPEPSTFDLQRQGAAFPAPPAAPGRFSLPQGGAPWNEPATPGGLGRPGDFDLPERPRLDVDAAREEEAARRLRLNDDRLGNDRTLAGRGFQASLPNANAPGNRSRAPSVSLSLPDRGKLPGDDRSLDGDQTAESSSSRKSTERAHAEITRNAASRSTAAQTATEKMWWPLTTTVLLLFGSLGGNVYLGWLAMDFYRRYRECAWELRTGN